MSIANKAELHIETTKKPMTIKKIILLLLIIFSNHVFGQGNSNAYKPAEGVLYRTIKVADSLMFEAFNNRDLNKLKAYFDPSIEVIQDNIGIRNYKQTIASFKELFKKDYVLNRMLIESSLEVYPIKNYGAIETGRHTFSHVENGKLISAIFKFVTIWKNDHGNWRITKIITYDH